MLLLLEFFAVQVHLRKNHAPVGFEDCSQRVSIYWAFLYTLALPQLQVLRAPQYVGDTLSNVYLTSICVVTR